MKINLGCGDNRLEGWQNHDSDVDITKPLPWPNESVDFILAEHVVEHITHIQALAFLKECRRILKRGGIVRLCIPVLDMLRPDEAEDIIVNHGHQAAYSSTLVYDMLRAARFEPEDIQRTGRRDCDGHWKIIGMAKDDLETCRMEAIR